MYFGLHVFLPILGQRRGQSGLPVDLFELHQGAHILQVSKCFSFRHLSQLKISVYFGKQY